MSVSRVTCTRCAVAFAPELVGGACPVCSTQAPGFRQRQAGVADKGIYLVAAATIANLLLLGILAAYLLN